jgi:hypothetical protein
MTYRDSQRYRKVYSYYRPLPRATDSVDKGYVDMVVSGLDWKQSVRVASDTNMSVISPGPVDGISLADEDRVLLKSQIDASENGIYVYYASMGRLVRALDAEQDTLTCGAATYVEEGLTNAQSVWILTTIDPIVVGTTAQTWSPFSAAGSIFVTTLGMARTVYSASFGGTSFVNAIGSDVFFYVSGSAGSRNTPGGAVAAFGGDVVITGSLIVNGSTVGGGSIHQDAFSPGTGLSGSAINFGTALGYQLSPGTYTTLANKKNALDVYFNGIRLTYSEDYDILNAYSIALTFDYAPADRLYITIHNPTTYP